MPLPPAVTRELTHTRALRIEIYRRSDGLWDIDALLDDTKTHDVPLRTGRLPAGRPIHRLWLRLTVDPASHVVAVDAALDAVPFAGFCDTIAPAYRDRLVGLNLLDGFRVALRERLAGAEGCTHLNELAMILPDVAAQVLPFEPRAQANAQANAQADAQADAQSGAQAGGQRPFMLDRCHALRTDGPAVAQYYPQWAANPSGRTRCVANDTSTPKP